MADVGCGSGYFTIPLAQLTAETVYGIDVSGEMLEMLGERAAQADVSNIERIEAVAEHIPLPDGSVDRILCSLVLHEVDDLDQTLAEFRRLLKSSGKLMVIEWERKPMEMGPPLEERIDAGALSQKITEAGFQCQPFRPNMQQYVLVAQ
ncbi:class I SAM-dependent methyltransferase [Alicyclobacillus acidiphilus]|uniref:class I SAM-dependent methyltransferase n=1 Tax=Alicyclobacillus acidiphilus TaxID=182455 RepID=UPI000835C57B|nr:class I SAM-dependent methyltransferase [Alicyclobacillus acidiphilus]